MASNIPFSVIFSNRALVSIASCVLGVKRAGNSIYRTCRPAPYSRSGVRVRARNDSVRIIVDRLVAWLDTSDIGLCWRAVGAGGTDPFCH